MDDPKKRQPVKPLQDPEYVEPLEAPASQPVLQITMEQLRELISAGRSDLNVAEAIAQGVAQVREPIPENKIHNGVSEANPSGNKSPIPALRCDMFLGVIDDKDPSKVTAAFKYEPEDLTDRETVALNLFQPIDKTIQMMDGSDMRVLVVARTDQVSGRTNRVIIGVPYKHLQAKTHTKNFVPPLLNMVKQLYGIDLGSMRQHEIDAIKAEHRKGNYVAQAEVAA